MVGCSVADPDPGAANPRSGSGVGKTPNQGSVMNIPDHFSESLETVRKVKNTYGAWIRIRDPYPGRKKIRDFPRV
jgi:hypothetical protein